MLISFNVAWADCPTGYACLLKDLQQQENIIDSMQKNAIKQHYEKPTIKEPWDVPINKNEEIDERPQYKDFLPFLPRYY